MLSRKIRAKALQIVKILFLFVVLPASLCRAETILVMGDSLSAAYGIEEKHGWVNLLSSRMSEHEIVNASVSGETTGGGLSRLPGILEQYNPDWVLIELGANDGLRGYPLLELERNLIAMIELVRSYGAKPLLMQIMIPPNYGERYASAFTALYQDISDHQDVPLLPFLLENIVLNPDLMQEDGLHPTAAAQPLIADELSGAIAALIR